MSNIFYHNEDCNYTIKNQQKLRSWINRLVAQKSLTVGEINFIFCSDDYLLEMNNNHLQHDYYTDIITFDYCEKGIVSGDLFISIDRIRDNAKKYKTTMINELHRVMAHGVLHLLGYKDKTDEESVLMKKMEDFALSLRDF